jgi:hypothetical protein
MPAGVGVTLRPTRSMSLSAKRLSSCFTCWLTAGCVRFSLSAAAEKMPSSMTSAKARS